MKLSISHRIFILVIATVLFIAWPLLYISEEMYQNHITRIVDETAQTLVRQTLINIEAAETIQTDSLPLSSSGRLLFIFDNNGRVLQGELSADTAALSSRLLQESAFISAAPTPIAVPVTFEGDNPKGWDCVVGYSHKLGLYVAACYDRDYTYEASASMQVTAGALALIVLAFGLLGAKMVSVRITKPLGVLGGYARSLPTKDFAADSSDELEAKLSRNRDKDIDELVRAFYFMENELIQHIRKEKEAATERERIKSELRIAAEIQQGALPQQIDIPRNMASISAHMLPAREVGGDLYDYFMLDENTLMFTLGDVSGKGVPASLFMFATQHMLRSLASSKTPLVELMAELNDNLSANNTSAMFVTMVVGRYDLKNNELEYALAGHQPPLLKKADGSIEELKAPANLPIGNVDGIVFESRTIQLGADDNVLVFTDGVTEACDSESNLFGMERLVSVLNDHRGTKCAGLLEEVFSSVAEFSKGCEMQDDVTVLCFRNESSE